MNSDDCPSRGRLLVYAVGQLSEETSERLAGHIGQCQRCHATLATLDDRTDALVARLRGHPLPGPYCREPACREAVAKVKVSAGVFDAKMGKAAEKWISSRPSGERIPVRETRTHANSMEPSVGDGAAGERSTPWVLGEYEILGTLGRGGMGNVYRARHTKLDRIVALKTLSRARLCDAEAIARFEREMKAVGLLRHPNIVEAYDARQIDGIPVLVMECIEGATLSELARRLGPLDVADAGEMVRQTALALEHAHEHGLVHRDVKPSNLMLTSTGQVKLLDLGLARFMTVDPSGGEMTGTGLAMGTAGYIAPEQVTDSHRVDIRADIYGLGCTLYRLLAGQAPFAGPRYQEELEQLTAHVRDPVPPLDAFRRDVPMELTTVLERMLAKDPDDRFSQPAEVAAALEPFARGCRLDSLIERFWQVPADGSEGETAGCGNDRLASEGRQRGNASRNRRGTPRLPKRTIRLLTSVAAATALVAVGISLAIVLRIRRGDEETVVHLPAQSEVTVCENGNVQIKLPGEQAAKPTGTDWEREVALWALRAGAIRLHLNSSSDYTGLHRVTREEDLPAEPFLVQVMHFYDAQTVRDQDLEILPKLRMLQGLALENMPITDRAIEVILQLSSLQRIYVTDTQITAEGVSRIAALANLEELGLGGLPVTGAVLRDLTALPRLNHLVLRRTKVTDAGLVEIAHIGSLRNLDLCSTAITDQGLVHLRNMPGLEKLNLEATQVSDGGLHDLKQIRTLRALNVKGTKLTAEGIASLREALPECKIDFGQ